MFNGYIVGASNATLKNILVISCRPVDRLVQEVVQYSKLGL